MRAEIGAMNRRATTKGPKMEVDCEPVSLLHIILTRTNAV
jgi:hypothetical protein